MADTAKGASSLQEKLNKFAAAMSSNDYVTTIRDGMMAYMPFTFIASIFLILACFPIEQFNDLVTMIVGVEPSVWQGKLMIVYNASIAISGLIVSLTIANSLAEKFNVNTIQCALTSMVSYLVLTPLSSTEAGATALELTAVSAQTMFVAILVGIFSVKIYQVIDGMGIKIKMPDAVPPAVSAPFESLIPSAAAVFVFWVLRLVFDAMGTDASSFINNTLGYPITLVGGSIFGIVACDIFQQLLWFFGIHGSSIVSGVLTPVLQMLEDTNRTLSMAGQDPASIISNSFVTHFAGIGVVGGVIAALICSKSKQYREISKIAAVPYIFNIGEPALFGFPMMLNFKLFVPFVFTTAVSAVVSYAAFALGFCPIPTGLIQLPWTTPLIISGFLVTESIAGSLVQLTCLVVSTLIWLPFMRSADRDALALEQAAEAEKATAEADVATAEGSE